MYIRKTSCQRCEMSIDEPLNIDWDGNELRFPIFSVRTKTLSAATLRPTRTAELSAMRLPGLEGRERETSELRYGSARWQRLTQKEVADRMGNLAVIYFAA